MHKYPSCLWSWMIHVWSVKAYQFSLHIPCCNLIMKLWLLKFLGFYCVYEWMNEWMNECKSIVWMNNWKNAWMFKWKTTMTNPVVEHFNFFLLKRKRKSKIICCTAIIVAFAQEVRQPLQILLSTMDIPSFVPTYLIDLHQFGNNLYFYLNEYIMNRIWFNQIACITI